MLALTLWPEWAEAIARLDKRVENRSLGFCCQIHQRVGTGWLAIHAGKNIGGRPGFPATVAGMRALGEMVQITTGRPVILSRVSSGGRPYAVELSLDGALNSESIVTSAVVAVARVGDLLPPGMDWSWKVRESGAVQLTEVVVLAQPVPCRGAQSLWALPPDVEAAVLAQVPA